MKINESKILKTMVKTYQDELDGALEDYSLIRAVLGLLIREPGAPEDEDIVRHLWQRQNKIVDKMKGIQENLDRAQEELKALKEESE